MIKNEEIILLENRYEIYLKKEIGRGQCGVIYECQDLLNEDPNKKICAKKITCFLQDEKSKREFELMSKLKIVAKGNPNIVNVIDVLLHDEHVILILERCECDLSDLIRKRRRQQQRFTPAEALEIIKQITNGYKLLLEQNIIHRDLKPQNILYLNNTYKIADFGLARIADKFGIYTKLGTPRYAAPQLFWDYQYSYSADIYSLGIIFYQLIYDSFPFDAKDFQRLKHELFLLKYKPIKVSRDLPEFKLDDSIPNLIEQMLLYHEKDRINWTTLFKHKLLINNQFETKLINQVETKSINQFQELSKQITKIEKPSKKQNINQQTTDFQNQIIPNTQPIISKEISKSVKGVDQSYLFQIFFVFILLELQKRKL
ncbi:unnamed protein product [Paramecium pentaurelia]|uniref:Protein kinase domain-containing protein n=1 Tax=Paramecium pentaurelia TaxID=43138 RepID=A0A8S1Y2Z5_9CILI|nr:unnamed protein product [Paramecium pentaurelia]